MSLEMTETVMRNVEIQNLHLIDSLNQISRNIDDGLLFNEVKSFYPGVHALGVSPLEMRGVSKVDTIWAAVLQWDSLALKIDKEMQLSGFNNT
ncbi:MAG: hypothetical protein IPP93_14380 [Chitinophagaceae bacterium]|nr:hypothetical protein [Chitinophagaceae bacterium]